MTLAQVAAMVTLLHGQGTALVRNPSPDSMHITVELRHGGFVGGAIVLADPVHALVSPHTFTLGPGERQTVRLRLMDAVATGTVLRLVTTFTPSDVPQCTQCTTNGETAAVARLTLVTRLVSKVLVQ